MVFTSPKLHSSPISTNFMLAVMRLPQPTLFIVFPLLHQCPVVLNHTISLRAFENVLSLFKAKLKNSSTFLLKISSHATRFGGGIQIVIGFRICTVSHGTFSQFLVG